MVVKSNRDKVDAISQAQRSGDLPSHFAAADLLALVLALAALWDSATPEFAELTSTYTTAHRRRVVTDAVAAVVAR
jgi:hypothetical protein